MVVPALADGVLKVKKKQSHAVTMLHRNSRGTVCLRPAHVNLAQFDLFCIPIPFYLFVFVVLLV